MHHDTSLLCALSLSWACPKNYDRISIGSTKGVYGKVRGQWKYRWVRSCPHAARVRYRYLVLLKVMRRLRRIQNRFKNFSAYGTLRMGRMGEDITIYEKSIMIFLGTHYNRK